MDTHIDTDIFTGCKVPHREYSQWYCNSCVQCQRVVDLGGLSLREGYKYVTTMMFCTPETNIKK